MRYFFKKTKKIIASLLIAIFVFNVIFISSAYPNRVEAKQTFKAFPTSFTSSWNNPAGALSKELQEDAFAGLFSTDNAAYPAKLPTITEKKAADKESTNKNTEKNTQITSSPEGSLFTEKTPKIENETIGAPTQTEVTPTSTAKENTPSTEPTEAPSTPVSFFDQPTKKIFNLLFVLLSGPEKVMAANTETNTSTSENETKPKNENHSEKEKITSVPEIIPLPQVSTPPETTTTQKQPIADETNSTTILNNEIAPTTPLNDPVTVNVTEEVAVSNEKSKNNYTEQSYLEVANFSPEHASELGEISSFHLKNPRLGLSLANDSLPGHEFTIYYKSEGAWQTLVTLKLDIRRSNEKNKGYFYFPLKKIKNINQLSQVEIKIAHMGETQLPHNAQVFVDAIWIETDYTDSTQSEQDPLLLVSEKKDFNLGEDLEFDFTYQKGKQESQTITNKFFEAIELLMQPENQEQKTKPDFSIQTIILDNTGAEISDIEPRVTFVNAYDFTVTMSDTPRKAKPGKYTLQLSVFTSEGLESYEQEFSWGVLAINSNKSMYAPGETAYLQMAALRDDGHTICNANLELKITPPTGNTATIPIERSEECGPNNVIDVPDYYSYYTVSETGEHTMMLTNLDNDYSISDIFVVEEGIPFSIERTGPTRIYPPADYPVTINITPAQHFTGTISEYIPDSFLVSHINISEKNSVSNSKISYSVEKFGQEKRIFAKVSWEAGKTYTLSYVFNAPNISPYMFMLGPAILESSEPVIVESAPSTTSTLSTEEFVTYYKGSFKERRQWQIASDAVGMIDPNGDGTVQCTPTPSGTHSTTVDEGARSPAVPNTGDYITCSENQNDYFTLSTINNVGAATRVDFFAYYKNNNAEMQWEVELWDASELTQYGTTQTLTNTTTASWSSVSFTGLSLTGRNFDDLRVKFKNKKTGAGSTNDSLLYATYAEVTYTPPTDVPNVTGVTINNGNTINLSENTTTTVNVTSTVSDGNGFADIQTVTGKLYRAGVSNAESCITNDNNCYFATCNLSNCSGNSCTATCSFSVQFHADPTDVGTPFENDYWRAWVQATDSFPQSAGAFSNSNGPDLSSLLALEISTSTDVNYGTLLNTSDQTPNYTDQKITVQSTGNSSLDILLYTSDITNGQNTFSGTYQKYSLSSSTLYTSTSSIALSTTTPGTEIELNIKKATSTLYTSEGYVWLGARAPYGVGSGTFSSTITILGVINEIESW